MTDEELVIYRLRNPQDINSLDRYSVHMTPVFDFNNECVGHNVNGARWLNGDELIDDDLLWLEYDHRTLLFYIAFELQFVNEECKAL